MSPTLPLLLLVDGHSLAFRAYYAFAFSKQGSLRTSEGIPTNVCFGFLNSLLQLLEVEHPAALGVAFDLPKPTFRHQLDGRYKANRDATPEDFIPDLQNLQSLLQALQIPILTQEGYEADDVLGTVAAEAIAQGYQVKILSGDRDLFQLIDPQKPLRMLYLGNRAVNRSGQTSFQEFDAAAVTEKMKVTPAQIVDYKALCGDTSDNIKGVKGIGDKTAVKLLTKYQSLEKIYGSLEELAGGVQKKLVAGKDDALLSQTLARIKTDVPLNIDWRSLDISQLQPAAVVPLLEKLELKRFLGQLEKIATLFGAPLPPPEIHPPAPATEPPAGDRQLSIFAMANPPVASAPAPSPEQPPEAIPIHPQIIDNGQALAQLIATLKTHQDPQKPVAWDTETTGLELHTATLVGLGCCWGPDPDHLAYIPLGHKEGTQLTTEETLAALREILEGDRYPKVFQNTKFDRHILHRQGIQLAGVVFDTMLASYVIEPEQSHNLTDLSRRYLTGITAQSYKDLNLKKGQTIADLPIDQAAQYCGLDVWATYHLGQILRQVLAETPPLAHLFHHIEMPLESVLTAMEATGIAIDAPYLHQLSAELKHQLDQLETQAYEAAGETFNLASPKQLSVILFEKLGLSTKKTKKTKTGYSTNHAILEKLQGDHPLIDHILEHRTLAKLKSTYVDALPALVNPSTQRIHTDFKQTVTATGRLSSSNPNLQNIPVRTDFSRQIRKAFVPRPGWLLVAADYSQIELRILTHLSQEPILMAAYQEGADVHSVTARLLLEKAPEEPITPQERRLGKIINFGVIYGMGAQRFARESGIDATIGKAFIARFHDTYAGIFNYLEGVKQQAIAQGYVTTLCDRRRYFQFFSRSLQKLQGQDPHTIDLQNLDIKNYSDIQSLRAAANATIQGSSADLIKIAMIKLQGVLQNYQANLLLQVHDELVLEVPPEEWETLRPQIKTIMESAFPLSVPLVVEINAGPNWMEAK